jgi:serine/threonine-protein kinase
MPTDLIGLTFGSYKLVELLGRGGMASVYRGYQESIDRSVAVKVLPPEFLHDPNFSQRFTAEARLLAKLTHPAILPLYDFGTANDVPYIVMPLMTGGTLNDIIKRGPLSLAEVNRLLNPIAEALDYAHSQGVIHRDIKPSNILFDRRGHPMLADFGIAKAVQASSNLTGTGIIGTPDYMSPEQARGEQTDGRSDLYSLAVMVYQCLTGDLLFKATTPIGVMLMHATEPPPPIRQKRADISSGIEQVLIKGLAKQPNDRFPTAHAFMQAFQAAAGVTALQQPTPFVPAQTSPPTIQPTGSAFNPATMPPPVKAATVEAAPARKGLNVGGVLIGGSLGIVLGIILVIGVIVVCCVGLVVMMPNATATPVPTPPPTATEEPTAIPFVLFDDFTDPNSGWETGSNDVSTIDYLAGEYAINVFETGWFVWGNPVKDTYSNISTEVNARYVGGNYSDILFGVMCNFQDNQHYYYLGIDTSGYYAIGKRNGNQDTILTGDGKLAFSNQLAQGNSWFRVTADCAGNGLLTLFVDGTPIDFVTDTDYPYGNIGLFVNVYPPSGNPNQKAQVEVHFDDLTVTQLP